MKSLLRCTDYRDASPGLRAVPKGQGCERLRISSLGNESPSKLRPPKQQHRVVVMGSARVGKSSIISQFLYDKFQEHYKETVEELHRGEYELPDGASLTLDILDTAGAYQFPAMRALSISTAGAFLLVYAVDDASSWEELCRLRHQVSMTKSGSPFFFYVIETEIKGVAENRIENMTGIEIQNGTDVPIQCDTGLKIDQNLKQEQYRDRVESGTKLKLKLRARLKRQPYYLKEIDF
ncbi:Dexamethasone-induced Ras-related protein 1 [Eumeta japonica]|uniref:Dexamethasone-induced Ras-related protein 1 n=1 Tax=Eumeta variegata TaxID=151549 RepID=A0A4C1UXK5_EUMVA|nr:Dexamethasone-induced Ras-related protein 1 [Eumeta japonica]